LEKFTTIDGEAWRKSLTRAREYRKLRDRELKDFIKEKLKNIKREN
jgi:hypothetical protein